MGSVESLDLGDFPRVILPPGGLWSSWQGQVEALDPAQHPKTGLPPQRTTQFECARSLSTRGARETPAKETGSPNSCSGSRCPGDARAGRRCLIARRNTQLAQTDMLQVAGCRAGGDRSSQGLGHGPFYFLSAIFLISQNTHKDPSTSPRGSALKAPFVVMGEVHTYIPPGAAGHRHSLLTPQHPQRRGRGRAQPGGGLPKGGSRWVPAPFGKCSRGKQPHSSAVAPTSSAQGTGPPAYSL